MKLAIALVPVLFSACVTMKPAQLPPDVRSILVVPPVNRTPVVEAPSLYLTTVTRPLAEAGYYVFPVAVVEAMLKENGLPTPAEMNQVSPAKLAEVFGADLILYCVIDSWGTTFQVLNAHSEVTVRLRLVDPKTNAIVWIDEVTARQDSAQSQGSGNGLVGALVTLAVAAVVTQVVSNFADPSRGLARQANQTAFGGLGTLPPGPYLILANEAQKKQGLTHP